MKGVIEHGQSAGATYFEIRVESVASTMLKVQDGKLVTAVSGEESGVAARALVDGGWGFATEGGTGVEVATRTLDHALSQAGALGKMGSGDGKWESVDPVIRNSEVPMKDDFSEVEVDKKLSLLMGCHKVAGSYDAVKSASFTYIDSFSTKNLWTSEGSEVEISVPRVLWSADFVARKGDFAVSHRRRIGKTGGMEAFKDDAHFRETEEGCRAATSLLSASAPPSGSLPVVIDPDLVGVFCHEALGHVVEGDLVSSGNSCLAGKIGQTVGSPMVNIHDDPTIPGSYGTFPCDDEGMPAMPKLLVEGGVLKDYILDRESAAKLGMSPNGACRAEDFRSPPIVRMSNTYIGGGDRSFDELLEGVKKGVYLRGSRGGQVDTVRGLFQFNAQEATLIEKGELTTPLRDVSMSGSTLEVLSCIDALGVDIDLTGAGICGKDGQHAPVGQGGPYTRISKVIVGGGG